MKSILLLFVATTIFTLPLRADDIFPKIGGTYKVSYAAKPSPADFRPDVIRILTKGSGSWVLIEAEKGVDATKVSFWLNFDWLLSATEIQESKKDDRGPAPHPESE